MKTSNKKRKYTYKPTGWQLDPEALSPQLPHVQYWKGGVLMTAQMTRDDAKNLVRQKRAYIICSQAIGAMNDFGEAI